MYHHHPSSIITVINHIHVVLQPSLFPSKSNESSRRPQPRTNPPPLPLLALRAPRTRYASLFNLPLLPPHHVALELFDAQDDVLEVVAGLGYTLHEY